MSETQAVMTTLNTGMEAKAHVMAIARRFEKLNNIPVRIIDDDAIGAANVVHAHFGRYALWRILPKEVDRVIYLDTDILPLRPLSAIPDVDFAAAPESTWLYDKVADTFPIIKNAKAFFNSGVFVATRKTEPIFECMLDKQNIAGDGELPWLRDQTLLNLEVYSARNRGDISFAFLPTEWNQTVQNAERFVQSPSLIHFAGIRRNQFVKTGFIAQIVRYLDEVEALIDVPTE